MKTGAVIVAAGLSSRMKSFKPMLQLGGSTVIKTAIETLKSAGVDPIVVVTGREAERLQHHLAPLDVTCIYNQDYRTTDMFFSACLGLDWIRERCERLFFLPADVPLFSKRSLLTMMGFMDYAQCDILLPSHKGHAGHPVLLQNAVIASLLQFKGDGGLRAAMASIDCSKETIELLDMGMTLDADRPEDYQRLKQYAAAMSQTNPVTCSVQLSFSRREVFFQDDTAVLLEKIALAGSLSAACKLLSISYSTGWKMIKTAESQLSFDLLDSHPGGDRGGSSQLTLQGTEFLTMFLKMKRELELYSEQLFQANFSNYLPGGTTAVSYTH